MWHHRRPYLGLVNSFLQTPPVNLLWPHQDGLNPLDFFWSVWWLRWQCWDMQHWCWSLCNAFVAPARAIGESDMCQKSFCHSFFGSMTRKSCVKHGQGHSKRTWLISVMDHTLVHSKVWSSAPWYRDISTTPAWTWRVEGVRELYLFCMVRITVVKHQWIE